MGRTGIRDIDLETKRRIKELRDMGIPIKIVAQRLGISTATVCNYQDSSEQRKYQNTTKKTPTKVYYFNSPEGIVHRITNISTFCTENEMFTASFYKVANGKQKTCKGWTFLRTEIIQPDDNQSRQ